MLWLYLSIIDRKAEHMWFSFWVVRSISRNIIEGTQLMCCWLQRLARDVKIVELYITGDILENVCAEAVSFFQLKIKPRSVLTNILCSITKTKLPLLYQPQGQSIIVIYIDKIYSSRDYLTIIAVTIDEGISGYRDEGLTIAKDFCSEIGIENRILNFSDTFGVEMEEVLSRRPSGKISLCSFCGTFRRRSDWFSFRSQ